MSEDLPSLLPVFAFWWPCRRLSVCVPVCVCAVHIRGTWFDLACLHEVRRNGSQVLGHGSWFFECHQGPPTWSGCLYSLHAACNWPRRPEPIWLNFIKWSNPLPWISLWWKFLLVRQGVRDSAGGSLVLRIFTVLKFCYDCKVNILGVECWGNRPILVPSFRAEKEKLVNGTYGLVNFW